MSFGTSRLTRMPSAPILFWTGQYSINVLLWLPRCQGNAVNTTFCGPARDTILSNRKTEKSNFELYN